MISFVPADWSCLLCCSPTKEMTCRAARAVSTAVNPQTSARGRAPGGGGHARGLGQPAALRRRRVRLPALPSGEFKSERNTGTLRYCYPMRHCGDPLGFWHPTHGPAVVAASSAPNDLLSKSVLSKSVLSKSFVECCLLLLLLLVQCVFHCHRGYMCSLP